MIRLSFLISQDESTRVQIADSDNRDVKKGEESIRENLYTQPIAWPGFANVSGSGLYSKTTEEYFREGDEKQFRGTIHPLTKLSAKIHSLLISRKPRSSYQNIQRIALRRVRLCSPGVDGSGLGWESSRHQEMATVSSLRILPTVPLPAEGLTMQRLSTSLFLVLARLR